MLVSDGHEYHLDRIDAFLHRSKKSPLHIHISWLPTKGRPSAEEMDWDRFCALREAFEDETLPRLCQQIARWKSFYLSVETPLFMSEMLLMLNGMRAPMLTDLSLRTNAYLGEDGSENGDAEEANGSHQDACYAFEAGSDIQTLYMHTTAPDWNCQLPYAGLQSLTLESVGDANAPSVPDFMNVLAASPRLEVLILNDFSFDLSLHFPNPPYIALVVKLPLLRDFVAKMTRPIDTEALIRHLRVPHVTVMELDWKELHSRSHNMAVVHLSTPYDEPPKRVSSLDSVQALRIGRLQCAAFVMSPVFIRLVNLRVLIVDCFDGGWDDFLYPLMINTIERVSSAGLSPYLPLFSTLICPGITGQQLQDLVMARKAAGVPIRRVFVTKDTRTFSVSEASWISKNVEMFGELPSSTRGRVDFSPEDLLSAHFRAELDGPPVALFS